jgi:hypothetical protein
MSPVNNFDDYSSDWDFDFESRTNVSGSTLVDHRSERSASRARTPSTPFIEAPSSRRPEEGGGGTGGGVGGLFSFDEARRVLDELNERLRHCGVGTQKMAAATSASTSGGGVETRRSRVTSADSGGARVTSREEERKLVDPVKSNGRGSHSSSGTPRTVNKQQHQSNYPA